MELGLEGKVALVTGSSRGIGRAIATILAAFVLARRGRWLHGAVIDMDGGQATTL